MPAAAPLQLFAYWRTSATFRVRVALHLKGLAATERFIDVDAGEHRSEAYLRINPLGAVPALVEGGQPPLTQSLAILEFLEELKPEPALLPRDLHGRARVRSLAGMLASDTHPLVTPRVRKYLSTNAGLGDGTGGRDRTVRRPRASSARWKRAGSSASRHARSRWPTSPWPASLR